MEEKKINTKVAGVSFGNRQEIIKQLKSGDKLKIEHDKDNPFDSNCQNVVTEAGDLIGNLKRELAADVVNGLNGGWKYHAVIKDITGRDKHTLGVNIELVATK